MILDYLLQIEIFLYMLEVQISVSIWKEERTERPSQFAITETEGSKKMWKNKDELVGQG